MLGGGLVAALCSFFALLRVWARLEMAEGTCLRSPFLGLRRSRKSSLMAFMGGSQIEPKLRS